MRVHAWFRRIFRSTPSPAHAEQSPVAEGGCTELPEVATTAFVPATNAYNLETPPPASRASRSVTKAPDAATALDNAAPLGPFAAGLAYGWITDVGRMREHNEDSVYVFVAEQQSSLPAPPFGLFILADGMGGHQAGEVASALACQTVAAQLMERVYLPLLYRNGNSGEVGAASLLALTEMLAEAIQSANLEVYASTPGSGTTLTCALLVGDRLMIGHVGDSRAYLQQGQAAARLLTNDHSMVKQLVDIGQLTPAEAAVHPRRNILYRAVGQGGLLSVDVQSCRLEHDAQLLLCTDGLWGLVPDAALWEIVAAAPTAQVACARFVEAANAAGGNDNITAIVVQFRREG